MSAIDERIAKRRADVRDAHRRRRLRRTIALVVAAVVVTVLVVVERSPLVALEEVQVEGTVRADPAQVRGAADLELGTSTLRLQLDEAEQRVRALSMVRDAQARRLDPLTVLISVVEREPVLQVDGDGGHRLVDRDGVVLDEGGLAGLPIVALSGPLPDPGAHASEHPALANAVLVWRGLSGPLRAEVVRYVAQDADELTLELTDGTPVRFGRAQRIDEKVRALGAVLGDLDGSPVDAIDVRAPMAPVVEPATTTG